MLDANWRFKSYLVLFLLLFSGYFLIPSFGDFKTKLENYQTKGINPPWFYSFFPNNQINLGLDLQGGIYLELEVQFEDAIHNQVEMSAANIDSYLKEEQKISSAKITRVPKTNYLRFVLADEPSQQAAETFIQKNYLETYHKISESPELVFQLADAKQYVAIREWLNANLAIIDTELVENHLFIGFPSGVDKKEAEQKILQQFPFLKIAGDVRPTYYKLTESSYNRYKDQVLKQSIETIRNRIDRYGVTEPSITRVGDKRVAIELPGETDPDRTMSVILQAGKLEFRLVDNRLTAEQLLEKIAKVRADKKIAELYDRTTVESLNQALKGLIPDDAEVMFELIRDPQSKKITGGNPFLVKNRAELSGEMLKSTQVNVDKNKPYVGLNFKPEGQKIFGEVTEKNVGQRLAIVLDGNINSAPVIENAIYGGNAMITFRAGNYDKLLQEAEDLVVVLREGALPASLKEATKSIVGPSLGKTSIQKGMWATIFATGVVILFMIFYYRVAGIVADIALVMNVFFILALLAMFGATLTLPGVAGLVLTVGMAVDANVIIYERIKEALSEGKKVIAAVEEGFAEAMSAILDGNITTFLAGLVLYQFGTGPVKGFAVTLMIGIVTTLFTTVLVSHLMMQWLARKDTENLSI